MNKDKTRGLTIVLFYIYEIRVVWMTLAKREPRVMERVFEPRLFWAFREWAAGNSNGKEESIQYIANVLFFIPYGFLFPQKKLKSVLLISLLTSVFIEVAQYICNLGWCEIDDVISNILGAVIGFGIYRLTVE